MYQRDAHTGLYLPLDTPRGGKPHRHHALRQWDFPGGGGVYYNPPGGGGGDPPPPSSIPYGADEPRYTASAGQSLRFAENWNYTSISQAYVGGGGRWITNGGAGQSIQIGGGTETAVNAYRQAWNADACGAEDDRVLEGPYDGSPDFPTGATEYYTFYYKTTPGFIYGNDGCPTRNGKKHFLLYSTGGGQRWTINPAWGKYIETSGPNVEYLWDSYAPYANEWAFVHNLLNNGQWHRFTYLRKPETALGVHNGRVATWFDGVKRFERLNFGADPSPMGAIQIFSTFNGGSPQVQSEFVGPLVVWWGAAQ